MPPRANPFLTESALPYQLPPFADITDDDYRPAIEQGMSEQRAEIAAIVADEAGATFENTILPLERSGRLLRRVLLVFYNRSSADSSDAADALEEELAPVLAAHRDAIRLDPALYARICELRDRLDTFGLDAESRYLVERYHTEFTLAGSALDAAGVVRLRAINERLSTLKTRFEKHLHADMNARAVHVTSPGELEGLASAQVAAAAMAARDRGLDGWLITLVLPTGHPYLATLAREETRDRLMLASRARGTDGEHDTRPLVLEICRLRAERARLLGFENHAAAVTADSTAGTPDAVAELLGRLAPAAARNARREQTLLQERADRTGSRAITAADWAFRAEEVRRERFDVDRAAVREYFEFERVLRDGVFFAASALYGVTFTERRDLDGYHPDVRVFEVHEEDGSPVGLYLGDFYARESKRGGAWMNSLVEQSDLVGTLPVVVNNLNVPKPPPGEPTLLSLEEATTLFHEFGHALHGLFARTRYPYFSGTNVFRDFVEYPSQVNEMWLLHPAVLERFAIHHETGERMPRSLVEGLLASCGYNEGFATSEYLAAALLDHAWHTIGPDTEITDVKEFESAALASAGLDNPVVPPRYSSTYFAHAFSGGYDAAYYSYMWSEVLDADTVAWFEEHGGLTRENGDRFRRLVLGIGGSRDPLAAYREFRGRDASIEPLLERRGLGTSPTD